MVRRRLQNGASNLSDRLRTGLRATYRERYDDVNPNEIVGDVAVAIIFTAIGLYGLWATLTTATTTLAGRLGALGVIGIEAALVFFGVMHGLATWHVYQRSEPRYRYSESVDGYVLVEED